MNSVERKKLSGLLEKLGKWYAGLDMIESKVLEAHDRIREIMTEIEEIPENVDEFVDEEGD